MTAGWKGCLGRSGELVGQRFFFAFGMPENNRREFAAVAAAYANDLLALLHCLLEQEVNPASSGPLMQRVEPAMQQCGVAGKPLAQSLTKILLDHARIGTPGQVPQGVEPAPKKSSMGREARLDSRFRPDTYPPKGCDHDRFALSPALLHRSANRGAAPSGSSYSARQPRYSHARRAAAGRPSTPPRRCR